MKLALTVNQIINNIYSNHYDGYHKFIWVITFPLQFISI